MRARLVADGQQVAEAVIADQQGRRALAFQKRIGGDGGADLHRINLAIAQQAANAFQGGIVIGLRIFAQQLGGDKAAIGLFRHDVGEGAAAIDPELPAHRGTPC